mmetsp:Transcript_29797/g.43730  ORF Transcript_29797/g.43730 Transcript_29797/m.43730 type:complete len:129 (+) Transcript_29797:2736-3122(+)
MQQKRWQVRRRPNSDTIVHLFLRVHTSRNIQFRTRRSASRSRLGVDDKPIGSRGEAQEGNLEHLHGGVNDDFCGKSISYRHCPSSSCVAVDVRTTREFHLEVLDLVRTVTVAFLCAAKANKAPTTLLF